MNTSNNNHIFMNDIHGNEEAIVNAEYKHSRDCFLRNVFLFLDNAERILGDPRMAMARVSVSNGLAYMGAFPTACIGAYLDWWLHSGIEEILHDKEGRKALTWSVSGSPLSGMNSCSCVYPDGSIATISHGSFGKIWKSFLDANGRCRPKGESVEPFSIEEVVEILKTNAITEEDILRARLAVQQSVSSRLRFNLRQHFGRYMDVCNRYESMCLKYHKDELSAFRTDLLRMTAETEKALQAVAVEVSASRKEYREGVKSKDEHTKLMDDLNKRRGEIEQQLKKFKADGIARLTADGELTKELIESYLSSK